MTWNYRIVKQTIRGIEFYSIREVYSMNGKLSTTVNPCWVQGADLEELKADFENYAKAFDAPVLDFDKDFR